MNNNFSNEIKEITDYLVSKYGEEFTVARLVSDNGDTDLPNKAYVFPKGQETDWFAVRFETDENTTIRHAVISKEPVNIQDVDIVDNAYERILQYEKDGLLVINHFNNLSEEQKKKDRNMALGAINRLELLKGEHPLSNFVSIKFPDLWEEALTKK